MVIYRGRGKAEKSNQAGSATRKQSEGKRWKVWHNAENDLALPPRPEMFDFHGVSMTHYFTDNWENIQDFQARPDDILIATYPKAGTTWVSYILDLLYFGQTERQTSAPIFKRVPFLEAIFPTLGSGKDLVDNLPPLLDSLKLTFQSSSCQSHFGSKTAGSSTWPAMPKDHMVSYFHFARMNMVQPEPGDWSNYIHRFMDGKMVFGSWYDHVNVWWKKKQTYSKLHYMFYEDLVEDTGREIDKLCCFLGLSRSNEEKKRLADGVHFDNMKKDNMANYSTNSIMDLKMFPFMRKGKVGDWKNHFSVAESKQFDEDYKKKMTKVTLQFRTEI